MKMKTRKIVVFIFILALFVITLAFSSCGNDGSTDSRGDGGSIDGSHTHEFTEWSVVRTGDCYNKGREMRTCQCGAEDYRDTDYVHKYEHIEALDATHDTAGYKAHEKCLICNATSGYEAIPALDCSSSTKASCTRVEYCDTCQTLIQYAAHSFENGVCADCGELELTAGLEFELKFDGEYYYSVTGISNSAKYVVIPNVYNGLKVKEIASAAFENDLTVEKVYIPSNVQTVGNNAFNNCAELDAIFIASKAAPATTGANWNGSATLYFDGNFTLTGNVASAIVANNEADRAYDLYIKCLNAIADNYTAEFSHTYDVGPMKFIGSTELKFCGDTRYGFEEMTTSGVAESYVTKIESYYNDGYLYSNVIMQDGASLNAKQYSTLPITQFMAEALTDSVVIPGRADFAKCVVTDNGDGTTTVVISTENGYTAAEIAAFIDFESIPLNMDLSTILAVPGANAGVKFIMSADCSSFSVELEMSCSLEEEGVTYNMSYESSTVYSDVGTTAEQICADKDQYVLHNHNGTTDDTCAEVKCRACNNIIKEASAHKYEQFTCAGATCSVCGNEIVAELEHIYKDGACIYCKHRQPSYGLTYEISSDGEYYIVTGIGVFSGKEVIIPALHEGLPVKEIKESAFASNTVIESVVLPDGMTAVGESAFKYCTALKTVIFSDSVTDIGIDAFNCTALENVTLPSGLKTISNYAFYECDALTSIEIPEGVTSIGYMAFGYCDLLKAVVIPSTAEIGESAFKNCVALESLTLNDGVKKIGISAFSGCTALKTVTVPDSVTEIGKGALVGCTALESITIPFTGKALNVESNANFSDTGFDYIFVESWSDNVPESLKEVTVTKSVPKNAFYQQQYIERVIIADGVTSIGEYAFYGCVALKEVVANSVTSIGANAFTSSSALNKVAMNSVISIGHNAFQSCVSLVDVTLPASLTESSTIFDYSLVNVYYSGTLENWCNITFVNAYGTNPMAYAEHFYMLDEDNEWFEVTEIVIPETVTEIRECQFYGFDNLKKLVIPNTVTSIAKRAFQDCDSLESITLPYVMDYQLYELFKSDVLDVKNEFKEIIITSGSIIPDGAFHYMQSERIALPEGITSIGKSAFAYNSSLTTLTIPNSVNSVGTNAFSQCFNLVSLTIGSGVSNTSDDWFGGNLGNLHLVEVYNLTALEVSLSNVPSIKVIHTSPEAKSVIRTVGDYIFAEISDSEIYLVSYHGTDTEITLPENYNGKEYKINDSAFAAFNRMSSIQNVTIPDAVTSIGSYAFYYCESLTKIIIGNGVTSIGGEVFSGCDELEYNEYEDGIYLGNETNPYRILIEAKSGNNENYVLNSNTAVIYPRAFNNLVGVTSVTIHDGVTEIGANTFKQNSKITELHIGSGIKYVGEDAFYRTSVNTVYYNGTLEDWNKIIFANNNSNPVQYGDSLYVLDENGNWYDASKE